MGMTLITSPLVDCFDSVKLLHITGRQTCSATARWTSLGGDISTITEIGYLEDLDDIRKRVWARAFEEGWTPKRWWKFWRWDDTPNPNDLLADPLPRR